MRLQTMLLSSSALACTLLLAWPQSVRAQAMGAHRSSAVQGPRASGAAVDAAPVSTTSGAVLLGGKLRGIASQRGLEPFMHAGIELGYIFPALDRSLGALLQVEYSVPSAEGNMDQSFGQERVPGGGFRSQLLQKELVLQPTFLYRMTSLFDSITPFVGLGLRVYLLESIITAKAEDETIEETTERSTEFGGGLPIGAEFALGPGALTGEVMLQWGPLSHLLSGHLSGVSAFAGYRVLR
jgi:hypothetical protein